MQIPITGAAASVADSLYDQVRGRSNSRSSSGSDSRSDPRSGMPRSKARVDSEVQIIQGAVTNLKVRRCKETIKI